MHRNFNNDCAYSFSLWVEVYLFNIFIDILNFFVIMSCNMVDQKESNFPKLSNHAAFLITLIADFGTNFSSPLAFEPPPDVLSLLL